MLRTQPRWPWSGRPSGGRERASQSWTAPCSPALARTPPCGLNATLRMAATRPYPRGIRWDDRYPRPGPRASGRRPRSRAAPWRRRHRWPAWPPSALNARLLTAPSWPSSGRPSSRRARDVPQPHCPVIAALASVLPSGLKAIVRTAGGARAERRPTGRCVATSHSRTCGPGRAGEELTVRAELATMLCSRSLSVAWGRSGAAERAPRGDVPQPHRRDRVWMSSPDCRRRWRASCRPG